MNLEGYFLYQGLATQNQDFPDCHVWIVFLS